MNTSPYLIAVDGNSKEKRKIGQWWQLWLYAVENENKVVYEIKAKNAFEAQAKGRMERERERKRKGENKVWDSETICLTSLITLHDYTLGDARL